MRTVSVLLAAALWVACDDGDSDGGSGGDGGQGGAGGHGIGGGGAGGGGAGGGGAGGGGAGGGGAGGGGAGGGGAGGGGAGGGGAGGGGAGGGGAGGEGGGGAGGGGAGGEGGMGGGGMGGGFERFELRRAAGPCPPEMDCEGFFELTADGHLRVDHFGELPVAVHEAQVIPDDMEGILPLLTDPALIALLDLDEPPCPMPADIFEQMTLDLDGVSHANTTTACGDAPILAARTVMQDLAMVYTPRR